MTSKTPTTHSTVVKSISSAIDGICRSLIVELENNDFGRKDIFAVHLALEEAFANAVKHGNNMDPKKEIKIDYSVGSDRVEVFITDEGNGFNPDVVPDPRCGKNLYKADGRGLFLVRSYMDVVEFNERGNRVRMVKYRKRKA